MRCARRLAAICVPVCAARRKLLPKVSVTSFTRPAEVSVAHYKNLKSGAIDTCYTLPADSEQKFGRIVRIPTVSKYSRNP